MAQQEGGWPLGLQPLNGRVGLIRNQDFSGSFSFNTLTTTASPSSSVTSSDLDTESTGSFFHDRSITLGSLIGIRSILELSNRSLRSRRQCTSKEKKNYKTRACFSLCSRARPDAETPGNAPSLGHFLEVERKAVNVQRLHQTSVTYEIEGIPESLRFDPGPNSLFSNGHIAPPRICREGSMNLVEDVKKSNRWDSSDAKRDLSHDNGYWFPTFSCMKP